MITRRVCAALVFVAVGCLLTASTSLAAVNLLPSASPLPGASFQGGDGNQTDANSTTKRDWQSLVGDSSLVTLVDPSSPDSEFGQGSSENNPDGWILTSPSESTPLKANFRVAWDQFHSEQFLNLAFRRAANGGNTFLAFELNKKAKTWVNGVGTTIPCRSSGDLLITYNVANADANDIRLTVQQWVSTSEDVSSGCSKTGSLQDVSGVSDGVNAQGAVNNSASNALSPELPQPPLGLPNNENGAIPSQLEGGLSCGSALGWICSGLFGEAALNLIDIENNSGGSSCFAYSSVWAHGRSSTSSSSALQDYVAPQKLAVRSCTISGQKWDDLNANGQRDSSELPIAGWQVYLDLNNNGKWDSGEPITTTDSDGEYLFTDVDNGTYHIRELATSGDAPLQDEALRKYNGCSYPSPNCQQTAVISSENKNSSGNNFGNYVKPSLTLTKKLVPTSDSGLFNLLIDDKVVASDVSDGGSSGKQALSIGKHTIDEEAGTKTSLDNYNSATTCRDAQGAPVEVSGQGELNLAAGDDVTCLITNTRIKGSITVNKSLNPSNDPGLFNLRINGVDYASAVGDGGSTGKQSVYPGSYTITEQAATGTDIANYKAELSCQDSNGPVDATDGVILLASKQDIVCTFTNTRKTGTITVNKTLSPSDDPGKFNLFIGTTKYATDVSDGGSTGVQVLPTGSYAITETAGTGTSLSDYDADLACKDADGPVTITAGKVDLAEDQAITCTFTNTRKTGTITVNKTLSPSDDPGKFNLFIGTTKYASDVSDGGSTGKQTLVTGSYAIAETAGTRTSLTSYNSELACKDDEGEVTVNDSKVNLSDGQNITCVFTNTRKTGTVKVVKSLAPSDDPGRFNLLVDDVTKAENVGDGGTTGTLTLPTGSRTVAEEAYSGTILDHYNTTLTCEDDEGAIEVNKGQFTLNDNQNVICTFTNTRKTGAITINKTLVPADDPGLFDLVIDGTPRATGVGDGGTTGAITLPTGSHIIGEAPSGDTSLDNYVRSLACVNDQGPVEVVDNSVELSEGEEIVCTFTNTRKTGTLTVKKSLSPASDPGKFDLAIDGTTKATAVGDGGSTGAVTVNTGSHTVSESGSGTTSLADYTSTLACEADGEPVPVSDGKVSVGYEEKVICTFVNTRQTGTINIVKSLTPGGDPGLFNLLLDGSVVATAIGNNGASGPQAVNTGNHTVAETAAGSTSLTDYNSSISCLDGDSQVASGSGTSLVVPVKSKQAIICTISNDNPPAATGTITITKDYLGDSGSRAFAFTSPDTGDFSLTDGQTTSLTVAPGVHPISETVEADFVLDSIACSDATDGSGASTFDGATANINVQAGETVSCTFTNSPATTPLVTGTARISGNSGCIFAGRNSYAYVRVRGTPIEQVVFYLRGKKLKTLTEPNSGNSYLLRYPVRSLRKGSNRFTARVSFTSSSSVQRTVLRKNIVRCLYKKPRYTG